MSSTHHIYSPSSMERRYLCPASMRLEKDMPEFTSEAAEAGTRIHEQAAGLINGNEGLVPLTDCYEQERAEKIADFFNAKKTEGDCETFSVERKLSFNYPFGGELFNGTADALLVHRNGSVSVFDWKTGQNPVTEAESNWQGAMYALAAAQEFGVHEASVTFYNPTINQVTKADFTADDLDNIEIRVMDAIAACEKEDAPCVPSLNACRYCKAAMGGTCKAFREWMARCTTIPKISIAELPDDVLAAEYERVTDAAKKYAEALKLELQKRAADKGNCGGYEIKVREGARQISDIEAVLNALSDTITREDMLSVCKVPITALQNLFAEKYRNRFVGTKVTAKEINGVFRDLTTDFITRGESTETLAKVKEAL